MADIYRLVNQIKNYEWGSPDSIPEFLGVEKDGKPWAEMWMGTHPGAPSQTEAGGKLIDLAGGQLPFLFKLLAAGKPLSIQAHPNLQQAREGFKRENEAGLALDDPKRNYKDPNHKPEILCALTPFTVMAGFRKTTETYKLLEALPLKETLAPLLRALEAGSLKDFFRALFALSASERERLSSFILESADAACEAVISPEQWELMRSFAAQYPSDPAVLSPLYLNLFTLEPGQAIFVPAGLLHAYVNGFGIELMAASDNVLRGGLTPKHIDISELVNILEFSPFMPEIIAAPSHDCFRYPAHCKEFSLSLLRGKEGGSIFPGKCPSICIVAEGEVRTGGMSFKKGESFFVPEPWKGSFDGNFSLFAAGVP
ncbi:MAG: mannose-6-phosphate isomerase, class I [Treponema sp.]|jgi:mannose-6-phosphate isomerase|nr:mannose-6-phosphate isomerase, class I [Treponema sp.]